MHILPIMGVLLIGGTWVVFAAAFPFSSKRRTKQKRLLSFVASALLLVGGIGFFGSALSAVGGLNWLPNSFEWPVTHATGVVSTRNGLHVVPHIPSGRVQVYDPDWTFISGWHVDALGGTFKIVAAEDNRIELVTARGNWHYVFSGTGKLLSKHKYTPVTYSSFPDTGTSCFVPTPPWLCVFYHPYVSLGVAAIGMGTLTVADRNRKKRKAPSQPDAGDG